MIHDRYGNPVSTVSREAVAKYDTALELLRLYRGDPIAALDEALAIDPGFGAAWATRAGILVQQMDTLYDAETQRTLNEGSRANLNDRERAHLAAAKAWAERRFEDGVTRFARIAQENPRDLVALQAAHIGCFYLGKQHELRDWPLQAMRAFSSGDDGHHAVLGMAAFGLEECGDYERADVYGRQAVVLEPRDGWAVHAVAHVNEMRGDLERGIPWLRDSADAWAPESGFAYHNWWHLALLHLDNGDEDEVLKLFDEKVRPNPDAGVLLELIDTSALLWRLHLEGVETGDRFAKLAACWERSSEDGLYAFNDLHAIMAFVGAGRFADAERTLAAMRRVATGGGDNAMMSREIGIPLAEGFIAFGNGRYGECVEKIATRRGIAQRFGGSHAQRDVLTLTALHAAIRGKMRETAEAFAAERLMHKPMSPWARRLGEKARGGVSRRAA